MRNEARSETLIDAALAYADAGWWVFPCYDNKRPATPHGFYDAVNDSAAVAALFASYPTATLIGVATGGKSGIFCIDFDTYKGPEAKAYLDDLAAAGLLPETRVHRTRSGGLHYFYSSQHGFPTVVPNDGVDVKGEGGYVILWDDQFGGEVLSTGVVDAPKELVDRINQKKADYSGESVEALKAKILRAENFHDSVARLAARYAAMGIEQGEVTRKVIEALRGSVASSPHHARHDRWRSLLADENSELSRIIITAARKYSTAGVSDDLHEAMMAQAQVTRDQTSKAFRQVPNAGEQNLFDLDVWPFVGQGYFAHENHDILKQRFVMHPIFCEEESVLIAAEPKTGKTAISLTVGLHIACGINLGEGLKVAEPRSVLYFGLEGKRAIKLRITAWRRWMVENGHTLPDEIPLFVVEASQNLVIEENRKRVVAQIVAADAYCTARNLPSIGAIFVDTFTKSMPGADQNSVEDTSAVFDIVGAMRDHGVTATVIFIHHKARAGNIRGSSNIEADPDVLTSIEKIGAEVQWRVDRARSVEEGGAYKFVLRNYDLGLSEQGFMINAPVVEATDFVSDAAEGLGSAKITNAVMSRILELGVGTFALDAVLIHLHEVGLGPQQATTKVKGPVRGATSTAQTYFADLIPLTGYAFSGRTVTLAQATNSKVITGLHIR